MDSLILNATAFTPYVAFDVNSGTMVLKGRSIPDQPDEFWLPILNWFESFMLKNPERVHFKIDLEYFNISSSKRILFLLYKLNELSDSGVDVGVDWCFRSNDEDMYEVGQDYAYMVKVPFNFCPYEETEMVLSA
jgi:hypothetical protein